MANDNTKPETSKPEPEGPKTLPDAERLKLTHELALKLATLTPNDRRHVLTAVAAALGVATSSSRPAPSPQRAQQNQQGRGR